MRSTKNPTQPEENGRTAFSALCEVGAGLKYGSGNLAERQREAVMSTTLRLSLDEYDQMIARGAFVGIDRHIELIRGEMREMNPAGPLHGDLIAYLTTWSAKHADLSRCFITGQSGVDMPDVGSRPEPDVFWIHRRRYRDRHPATTDVLLAMEVSDSSLEYDLGEKAMLYAEAGLTEYWVVDVPGQQVHVMRNPSATGFQDISVIRKGQTASPLVQPDARLDVRDLFDGE